MTAKRILILLLMWLIPLYPALAGTAMHQPSHEHSSLQAMHQTATPADHDCCDTTQSTHPSQDAGSYCSDGLCISHCAISLIDADPLTPILLSGPTHPQAITTAFSSITLEPPSRPPSLL